MSIFDNELQQKSAHSFISEAPLFPFFYMPSFISDDRFNPPAWMITSDEQICGDALSFFTDNCVQLLFAGGVYYSTVLLGVLLESGHHDEQMVRSVLFIFSSFAVCLKNIVILKIHYSANLFESGSHLFFQYEGYTNLHSWFFSWTSSVEDDFTPCPLRCRH